MGHLLPRVEAGRGGTCELFVLWSLSGVFVALVLEGVD